MLKQPKYGTLYPSLAECTTHNHIMHMTLEGGTANDAKGEVQFYVNTTLPVGIQVRSAKTGRRFVLTATHAINMAIEAGVESKEAVEVPKDMTPIKRGKR